MDTKVVSPKRFICSFPDCDASYNKEWKLDAHTCKHTGLKPYTCEHDGCGKAFVTTYHLTRHQLSHSGEKPFLCVVTGCTGAFTTNTNLQRHVNRTHKLDQKPDQKPYVCEIDNCGLAFKKNKQLKSHQCDQHAWRPSYQCSFEGCKMEFPVPSKLKRHEKVHKGYPCKEEGCAFMGKTWTEYTKHRKDAHKVLVQCDQCQKVFRDSWFLHQHQRVHADERQVLKCPRDGCDRAFTTVFNLQSHITSFHEELRSYVCPHAGCGKAFAMKQSLQRHSIAVHDAGRKKTAKQRPKRSLASRLSGYKPSKKTASKKPSLPSYATPVPPQQEMSAPAGPVALVSLLQDTTMLCSPVLTLNQPVLLPV